MKNIDLVEKILVANGGRDKYSTFDAFWDNQITNSFVVVDGPAVPLPNEAELIAANRVAAKSYLEPKYWGSE